MDKTALECLLVAGIGGTMPTLSKFGASLVADPNQVLPAVGFYIGLFIFFIIGSVMSYAFAERNLKQAFLAGIAAPAIIASTISGVTDTQPIVNANLTYPSLPSGNNSHSFMEFLFTSSHAEEVKIPNPPEISPGNTELNSTKSVEENLKKYNYSIISISAGSSGWRTKDVSYAVTLTDVSGFAQLVTLRANEKLTVTTLKPVATFKVKANGVSSKLINLSVENAGGELIIKPKIVVKKDLLWVFGLKGKPLVRGINSKFIPSK